MVNKDITKILVERGMLTKGNLDKARNIQKKQGGNIGEILVSNGSISLQQLDHVSQMIEIKPLERFLPGLIILFIFIGIGVGKLFPGMVNSINSMQIGNVVSIPMSIVLFFMMFPIMVRVDLSSIKDAAKHPKPVILTLLLTWLLEPFVKFFLSYIVIKVLFGGYFGATLSTEYLSGIILVGIAPCTAMVLMWSYLCKGNLGYSILITTCNVLIMLVAYAPIASFLLGKVNVNIPFQTIFLCVFMYVGISLISGLITRTLLLKWKGHEWFNTKFVPFVSHFSSIALLVTLIIIFSTKGNLFFEMPATIAILALPVFMEFVIVFSFTYLLFKFLKIDYGISSVSSIISSSNHFELGIATAIFLFGVSSSAVLATVVVPLIEVPVMLTIVKICLRTRYKFQQKDSKIKVFKEIDGTSRAS